MPLRLTASAAALGAALLLGACAGSPHFTGAALTPRPAPDFSLVDGNGRSFRLDEERGKVVVLFFGYTHCPDICPTTLVQLERVVTQLPAAQRGRVAVLFVTVDPQRDTPAHMEHFVRLFDPHFVGLTGSVAQLAPVLRAYHVFHQRIPGTPGSGYLIAHTGTVYLIDPAGALRVLHGWQDPPQAVAADLETLLS